MLMPINRQTKIPTSKRTFEVGIFVFYSAPATSREAYSPASGFRDSCRIAPFLPSRGNAPSAAFASFAGRHPGAAFPAPELSSLLRSSLVLTRLHNRDPFCGSFILDQAGVNTIKFSIFQLSPILHIFALL